MADCSSKPVVEDDNLLKPEGNKYKEQQTTQKKLILETFTEDYHNYVDFGNEYYNYLEDVSWQ